MTGLGMVCDPLGSRRVICAHVIASSIAAWSGLPKRNGPRGPLLLRARIARKPLAGLDTTSVCVAAVGDGGRVAPVALNLPSLGADGDEAAERPRALVGVLAPPLVVPGV